MSKLNLEDTDLLDNIGNGGSQEPKMAGMSKLEILKWIGAFFILSSAVLAAYNILPINFLVQGTGIAIWCIAGFIMKDKPLFYLNLVSSTLTFIAYINYIL